MFGHRGRAFCNSSSPSKRALGPTGHWMLQSTNSSSPSFLGIVQFLCNIWQCWVWQISLLRLSLRGLGQYLAQAGHQIPPPQEMWRDWTGKAVSCLPEGSAFLTQIGFRLKRWGECRSPCLQAHPRPFNTQEESPASLGIRKCYRSGRCEHHGNKNLTIALSIHCKFEIAKI